MIVIDVDHDRHARTFKANDGKTYRWVLLRKEFSLGVQFLEVSCRIVRVRFSFQKVADVTHHGQLETDEVPPKIVARFHKEDPKRKINGHLEIYGQGEKIMDDILVTFVYCEKFRRERTGEAAHGPGAPYVL
jgi:hypothetical protein